MTRTATLDEKCQSIRLLLSDVDGVLTDGRLIYSSSGSEHKEFHVRDGLGVKIWRSCGFQFGLVTARESPVVERRSEEMGSDYLLQSRPQKLEAVKELASQHKYELSEIAYVGDDLHDLSAVSKVGLGLTVSDAVAEVKEAADWVTTNPGGKGALREIIQMLLTSKGQWADAIKEFSG